MQPPTVQSPLPLVNGFFGVLMSPFSNPPVIIGHRGWPLRHPPNTLRGAIAAAGVAPMVEVDVRRSADGKLVLSHDTELGGIPVHEANWDRLSQLDLGEGERPALLDEVISALPGTALDIEVKSSPADPGFEPDHRIGLEAADRCRPGDLLTSFNWDLVDRVRAVFADVSTGLIVSAFGTLEEAMGRCLDGGHHLAAAHLSLVGTAAVVADTLSRGVAVAAWVVNDPTTALQLAQWGVSGIITDAPDVIAETMKDFREHQG